MPLPHRVAAALLLGALLATASAADDGPVSPDGGRYSGPLQDGLRHGEGRLDWNNGARYEGGFARGLFEGRGRLSGADGTVYEGDFRGGLRAGQGRLSFPDGSVYAGGFRDNVFDGQGRLERPDPSVYEGQFRLGRFEGQGKLSDSSGDYRGEFRQGLPSGQGELVMKNGSRYRGGFLRGQFSGKGRFQTADGQVYEGDFEANDFTGEGRFDAAGGGRHEGRFLKWVPQGPGTWIDPEGNRYQGDFDKGRLASGVVLGADGSRYEGGLDEFMPQGQGTLSLSNGDRYTGGFEHGLYHGEGTLTHAEPLADGSREEKGSWQWGERVQPGAAQQAAEGLEAALYAQRRLLDEALATLQPRTPGRINLYLLAVAGDGRQEVFRRETDFVQRQFDSRFGTAGHSLVLANSRHTLATAPMATLTSLREAVTRMAGLMDREQDILFVYLTSHGSREGEFQLDQRGLDLPELGDRALAALLKDSGIRWKVVVVSACYSGTFLDDLQDDHTLVITAARHDRTSFGCSDENDFTYFGRAFFSEALPASRSFQDAFRRAEKLVAEWEAEDARDSQCEAKECEQQRSLPQMASGKSLEPHLKRWWKQAGATGRAAASR